MEHVIGIAFFITWTILIIMVMNPALFIRLRYRIKLDDMDHYKSNDSDLAPDKDEKKLDRYV